MKKHVTVFVLLAGLGLLLAGPTSAGEPVSVFEKFKALAGVWEGQNVEGQAVRASYQVMSGGSAVVETLSPQAEPAMVTVYHMDGDDLRMTHYCSARNQPRMKAPGARADAGVVSFSFVDATNLAGLSDGHMNNLEVTFTDNDHITQQWTWVKDGKKSVNVITFARLK